MYEKPRPSSSQWLVNIASMLYNNGFHSIPNQEAVVKTTVKQMHINLKNVYISNWRVNVNNAPKCSVLYKHVKIIFEREYYITSLPKSVLKD